MREAWMGATSTPARVSSVAPIGNVSHAAMLEHIQNTFGLDYAG